MILPLQAVGRVGVEPNKMQAYTVKKVRGFPVFSRDVTYQVPNKTQAYTVKKVRGFPAPRMMPLTKLGKSHPG
jgi:hypothetical protein